MSRPSTHADLPTYSRRGATVVSVESGQLPPTGATFKAIGALLDSLMMNKDFVIENAYNSITVSKVKTTEELDAALRGVQAEWDGNQEKYNSWEEDLSVPETLTGYAIGNVLSWAKKEFPNGDHTWLTDAHKAAKVRDAQKS